MSQRDLNSNPLEHLLQRSDRSFSNKPPAIVSGDVITDDGSTPEDHQLQSPRRYWGRTTILIVVPVLVTAYYIAICLLLLRRPDDPLKYTTIHEVWIFYSWFVIGVFGLDWSRYALAGVEAAMLQTPFWQAPNAVTLLMHGDMSWSRPGEWFQCLKILVRGKRGVVHRLWFLLAFLSILAMVALPLSGLGMGLSDGYIYSSAAPMVIGRTWSNFHQRLWKQTFTRGLGTWEVGSPGTVPGIGVIYTPEHLSRHGIKELDAIPNTLPLEGDVPELFLSPQAQAPIGGETWGLHLGYNCSMVEEASEFTILSQKPSASVFSWGGSTTSPYLLLHTPSEQSIYMFNSSLSPGGDNLWAYIEIGVSNASTATYDGSEPSSFDPKDVEKADILEYALWQIRVQGSYGDAGLEFNSTIDCPIKGLGHPIIQDSNGTYLTNTTFFTIKDPKYFDLQGYAMASALYNIEDVAPPIGIRCRRVSALGTAKLDPQRSSFRTFTQTPPPPYSQEREESPTPRFGMTAQEILLNKYFELFTSTNSPTPITVSNSVLYQNFVTPQSLRQSLMRAHAMDALQLMYDGVYGFEGAWLNPNLTSSRPGKVLNLGRVSPVLPATIFAIWAAGCVILGLWYGFRRRWLDRLDGYTLFQFGIDLAEELKGRGELETSKRELAKCEPLWTLPGLMGRKYTDGHVQ